MSYELWSNDSGNRIAADLTEEQARGLVSELLRPVWNRADLSLGCPAWEQAISGDELRAWVEGE